MSHDTFIREVNEEIRQDRIKALWTRFGLIFAVVAVALVLATAGYVLWERHRASVAAADGDAFLAAVELADTGDTSGAIAALTELTQTGVEAYPDLARMRIASLQLAGGDLAAAVATFDAVAGSGTAPGPLRDVAAIRAGYILVDSGGLDDVRRRVERLTNDSNALRAPAREALAVAAWKAGDLDTASALFGQIVEDLSAPQGIAQRATLMQELIDADIPFAPMAEAPAADVPAAAPSADAPAASAPAPEAAAPAVPTGSAAPPVPEAAAPAPESSAAPSPAEPVAPPAPAAAPTAPAERAAPTPSPSTPAPPAPVAPTPDAAEGAIGALPPS